MILTDAQIFKKACYADNLQSFYKDCISKKILSIQSFLELSSGLHHLIFSPSKICRGCKKEVKEENFDYMASYWGSPPSWHIVHSECKKSCSQEETYLCQIIDADCSNCKFFERGKELGTGISEGRCSHFNKPTKAYVNVATGHKCFVHRKDI